MKKKRNAKHQQPKMDQLDRIGIIIGILAIVAAAIIGTIGQSRAEASDPRYPLLEQSTISAAHHVKVSRHYRRHAKRTRAVVDASGNLAAGIIHSRKTGATARVAAKYAPQFQAYIDDLENNNGAIVRFIGGIRRGKCWPGGLHPCGRAIDVCQLSRGRVDARCHLPSRIRIAEIAARHGLFEGGRWCNSDYGHAQAGVSAGDCGSRHYARHRRHKMAMR